MSFKTIQQILDSLSKLERKADEEVAKDEHVAMLKQGVAAWNAWRNENRGINLDLGAANLSGAHLSNADLRDANLSGADLSKADLHGADLSGADLSEAKLFAANLMGTNFRGANLRGADLNGANLLTADLSEADLSLNIALKNFLISEALGDLAQHYAATKLNGATLSRANLRGANLSSASLLEANLFEADLSEANLGGANLSWTFLSNANLSRANLCEAGLCGANMTHACLAGANVRGADLRRSTLLDTDLTGADLTGCRIFGISAWRLKLAAAKQQNLVITDWDEPTVTVDNIEVAQFIYLLLHNEKIRDVIDTITSKAVLILGRFTEERKAVLDAIRDELRRRGYLPILFDFDKPANRDVTETISLLARMARFVVADITDAKAVPQELNVIVPDLPSVPVQPLLLRESSEYGMFEHYARYPWVLPLYRYETPDQLIAALGEQVIEPAERKALEMRSGAQPFPPII